MVKNIAVGLVFAAICAGILAAMATYSVTCPYCGKVGAYEHTASLNAWFYDKCVHCKKDFKYQVKNGEVVKVEKIQQCQ